jgi:hypothetical protein
VGTQTRKRMSAIGGKRENVLALSLTAFDPTLPFDD